MPAFDALEIGMDMSHPIVNKFDKPIWNEYSKLLYACILCNFV